MRFWAIILAGTALGGAALFLPASHSRAQIAAPTDQPLRAPSNAPDVRVPQTNAEAGFTVRQAPSGSDAQEIIPLAPRVDNAAGNQPVDNQSR
jgi:hypothetical protein